MENLIRRIRSTQNKQKSLTWGVCSSENNCMFVVGSKAYPKQIHYFCVNNNFELFFISDEHRPILEKAFESEQELVLYIIELLKEWYPAKS